MLKEIEKELAKKKEKERKREELKKLSKDELKEFKEKEKALKIKKDKTSPIEFPYLEQLNEAEFKALKENNNWAVNDPGKRVYIYMKDTKGNVFRYTHRQYLHETKRIKYQKTIQNYKDKNNISVLEKELTSYNSKSCDLIIFKLYVQKKNELNKNLLGKYENDIFRKYKWYGYINRQKADAKMINSIKKIFGENVTIIYGDWSLGQQMQNSMSTPNLRLKRKIGEHFTVYSIDEFRTSCLNCKTNERVENMYLPDEKGVYRKKHSILTYKMSNNRRGCINRDNNAVNNMIKVTEQYLKDRTRPVEFRRDFKIEKKEKIKRRRREKQEIRTNL
jgi:hypothetical protein